MDRITLVSDLREDDLMTLRWNANINTVYQRKTGAYKILDNQGSYIGEIIKEARNKCRIVFYKNETTSEKYQKLMELKIVAERILQGQLPHPNNQVKKVIPFSRHREEYRKYDYYSRAA